MKQLTQKELTTARAWLHDVFVWGGLVKNPVRAIPKDKYWYMYGTVCQQGTPTGKNFNVYYPNGRQEGQNACETICNTIRARKADPKFLLIADKALKILSGYHFSDDLKSQDLYLGRYITKSAEELASYVAWYCATYNFSWDDSQASSYEKDLFKESILGKALLDFDCFIQTKATPSTTTTTTANNTSTSTTTATSSNKGQPKNAFKSRGPLSSVAVDLLTTPGKKEFLSNPVFVIVGSNANGGLLSQCLYIRPVEEYPKVQKKCTVPNGQGTGAVTNKVFYGSAKGYGYCPLYFTSSQEADNYLGKVLLATGTLKIPSGIDLRVAKKAALSNGYFKIGTQFGPAYISAEKLNENLVEEVEQTEEIDITPTEEELAGNVGGLTFAEFNEAFNK